MAYGSWKLNNAEGWTTYLCSEPFWNLPITVLKEMVIVNG
jgi:hypothetical protein